MLLEIEWNEMKLSRKELNERVQALRHEKREIMAVQKCGLSK